VMLMRSCQQCFVKMTFLSVYLLQSPVIDVTSSRAVHCIRTQVHFYGTGRLSFQLYKES
jgi:hypothetical protein